MIIVMHLRSRHINATMQFKGTVSGAIKKLKERYRIDDEIFGPDYSVLVDGNIAGPETAVGETLTILHAISGG